MNNTSNGFNITLPIDDITSAAESESHLSQSHGYAATVVKWYATISQQIGTMNFKSDTTNTYILGILVLNSKHQHELSLNSQLWNVHLHLLG